MQRENGVQGYNRRASKARAGITVRCKYVGCIGAAWVVSYELYILGKDLGKDL